LWDGRTGKPVGRDLRIEGELSSLAFSPDGRWILIAASDNKNNSKAQLWDARTGTPVGASREYTGDCPVAFSPDGKTFLMAFEFYETSTRKLIRPTPDALGGSARNVAFSPGGTTVLAGSEGNRTAQLWDVKTGKALGPPLRHQD